LDRYFRHELDGGMAILHFEVVRKFRDAIGRGEVWALQMALRNMPRFRWDRYDNKGMPFIAEDDSDRKVQIEFVLPTKKPEEQPPKPIVDVTPSQPVDYKQPRLEPPPVRIRTECGVLEMPANEQPSAFERPDPKGWMR
jgi:hypothetical protein